MDTLPLRAVGLDPKSLDAAVEQGKDRGYILPVNRRFPFSCSEPHASAARVQPLIETRPHAIVRRGSPPLTVDWDGTVRVLER